MKLDIFKRNESVAGSFQRAPVAIAIAVGFGLQLLMPLEAESVSKTSSFAKHSLSNKPLPAGTQTEDGSAYYATALHGAQQLNDYVVDSAVYTYKGSSKPIIETCKFYFKKPGFIRVEVQKAGSKSGSILVVGADHQIQAKPGSFFKFMKLDLSPNSNLLKTANGFSLLKCDFATLMMNMKNQADVAHCRCVLAKLPTNDGPNSAKVRHLEFVLPSNVVLQRIAFDDRTKLPIEWSIFKRGHLFSTSVWSNVKLNPGLADTVFTLN